MRFVLVSTHVDQTTGYSKVSHALLRQIATLAPKVKTFHFGFQRHPTRSGMRSLPAGITGYDAAANEDPKEEGFGFNKIAEYLDTVSPDVVMIYNDPVTICRFLDSMSYDPATSPYRVWVYLDQVYEGAAPPLMDRIRSLSDRVYCFSETWAQVFRGYGPAPDVRVLGHAVDSTVITSLPADARHSLRTSIQLPSDAIVLLNANRNSQRKRLDLTIQGFVRALTRNPRLHLMIASNLNPQTGAYYDIQRIFIEELGLHGLDPAVALRNLILVDTSAATVIDDMGVNQMYNLADIGINTSDGEGFGLCQLEHLATGAPQVVTNLPCYRGVLTDETAATIPASGRSYFAGGMPHGLWYPTFDPAAVAAAIESVVARLEPMKAAARSQPPLSWDRVCDSFLEDLLMRAAAPGSTGSGRAT
jgi:glycosyltransferase involved in cell wall biosynthesis